MANVIMTITVDWEGDELAHNDLQAMKILNAQLNVLAHGFNKPIPITHFICPTYFTRTDVSKTRQNNAELIATSGAIRPGDEVGVHIHCWKSLAIEAQVPEGEIVDAPMGSTFDPSHEIQRKGISVGRDTGYSVPLGIYSQANVKLLLDKSIQLLQEYLPGYTLLSFRTGMWVTCDVIFSALRDTALIYEASAFPFNYSTTVLDWATRNGKSRPMLGWLQKIWGATQVPGTEPSYVQNSQSFAQYGTGILGITDGVAISQPKKVGTIIEIPDTGALLPTTNLSYMIPHVNSAFELAKNTDSTVYLSIGFHQEGCNGPAFFEMPQHARTNSEKRGRLAAIFEAVTRAITQSINTTIDLEFLTIQQAGARSGL